MKPLHFASRVRRAFLAALIPVAASAAAVAHWASSPEIAAAAILAAGITEGLWLLGRVLTPATRTLDALRDGVRGSPSAARSWKPTAAISAWRAARGGGPRWSSGCRGSEILPAGPSQRVSEKGAGYWLGGCGLSVPFSDPLLLPEPATQSPASPYIFSKEQGNGRWRDRPPASTQVPSFSRCAAEVRGAE